MAEEKTEVVATETTEEQEGSKPSQETGKPEDKGKVRTEKEKAIFNLQKKAEEARDLGIDPAEILGTKAKIEKEEGDDVPEWYKREQQKQAQKTALELADGLSDPDQKALVINYLQHRIVPSGNPQDDFRLALSAASASKNKQIAEEVGRYVAPRVTAAGGSQPAKVEEEFTPTPEEARFMAHPYNTSKENIIAARKRVADKQAA